MDNDAAVVVLNEENIQTELERLITSKELVLEYGEKAWQCGVRNHQRKEIQNMIYTDFLSVKMRKAVVDENR